MIPEDRLLQLLSRSTALPLRPQQRSSAERRPARRSVEIEEIRPGGWRPPSSPSWRWAPPRLVHRLLEPPRGRLLIVIALLGRVRLTTSTRPELLYKEGFAPEVTRCPRPTRASSRPWPRRELPAEHEVNRDILVLRGAEEAHPPLRRGDAAEHGQRGSPGAQEATDLLSGKTVTHRHLPAATPAAPVDLPRTTLRRRRASSSAGRLQEFTRKVVDEAGPRRGRARVTRRRSTSSGRFVAPLEACATRPEQRYLLFHFIHSGLLAGVCHRAWATIISTDHESAELA